VIVASQPQQVAEDYYSYIDVQTKQASVRAQFLLAVGTITSLAAYSDVTSHTPTDGDYGALPLEVFNLNTYDRTFSEELTFSSRDFGPLQVVAGGFYYRAHGGFDPSEFEIPLSDASFAINTLDQSTAEALFTQITYRVSDRLSLIGGVRLNHEVTRGAGALDAAPQPIGKLSDTRATPRFSATYALAKSTRAYFTYSDGFKSGLFNSTGYPFEPAANSNPVRPETVKAYEVGLKYEPDTLPVRLHGALFYNDYSNLQVSTLQTPVAGGPSVIVLQNAGTVESYGFDGDATWAITRDLTLVLGANWLHSKYVSFPNAAVDVPAPGGLGDIQTTTDASGNWTIRSPRSTFNLDMNYSHQFGIGTLGLSSSLYYSSRVYFDAANIVSQSPYTLLNMRAFWQPPGSGINVGLWTRNLTGQSVIASTVESNTNNAVNYLPPRTFGIDARYAF
jgi:iron complex outermembrane recepter protein